MRLRSRKRRTVIQLVIARPKGARTAWETCARDSLEAAMHNRCHSPPPQKPKKKRRRHQSARAGGGRGTCTLARLGAGLWRVFVEKGDGHAPQFKVAVAVRSSSSTEKRLWGKHQRACYPLGLLLESSDGFF